VQYGFFDGNEMKKLPKKYAGVLFSFYASNVA
jgi:hypothetical protein